MTRNPFQQGDYAIDRTGRYWLVLAVHGPWCWLKPNEPDDVWSGPWNELARNLRPSEDVARREAERRVFDEADRDIMEAKFG